MTSYIRKIDGLIENEDPYFGLVPTTDDALNERLMNTMVGRFMGADARKGLTYRWIPNHLQDADGRITPRSFIKLFSIAATIELDQYTGLLPHDRLLRPTNIQGALMQTSQERITELAEEYPWIQSLKPVLKDIEVPVPRPRFITAIERVDWGAHLPPSVKAGEQIDDLVELGIIEKRSDDRINIPEIYMYGFGMKRRGGIKRPR